MKKIIYFFFPIYRFLYFLISTVFINIYMNILKIKLRNLGNNNRIYFAHIVEPYNISIGHHVYINRNCDFITTSSRIILGNYIMIGPNVTFIAQNHDYSNWKKPMILNHRYRHADIIVENDVWIGANVTILAGVTIGRGAIVAAGAVVNHNVLPYTIVGGVPAKKIKDRFSSSVIKKAQKIDLSKFQNHQINWYFWGVGKKV